MLWVVTGAIGSGKSDFAVELALSAGSEGIRLSCPPFPFPNSTDHSRAAKERDGKFLWTSSEADESLAHKLHAINMESNIFRAERRVIVVDSLSGWLRLMYNPKADRGTDMEKWVDARWRETLEAICSFEGKIIIVTEEPSAGLDMPPIERDFVYRLAAANRKLMASGATFYRMTAGMATEVKGYRLKRRDDEI
ncbi:bifunctional adenosylcobinamide kinase/adenosylcobinamide-phosphate guanylyltransferase [Cohnella terricola]|uniref:Uncharacterized protein n=1 Tax=Cohnella terricola TaxID=1289167 RepID=A0A559JEK9_9BACL|nr:bifunctional adenosylcobinamide kinase/adenosylcobinamide-phosphate guanylyltransferase [Cohnella terricola]TVX98322.1 hypothetical protein FPZ45_16640 [Cohnella terricola]